MCDGPVPAAAASNAESSAIAPPPRNTRSEPPLPASSGVCPAIIAGLQPRKFV